jgi:Flp pilus assembly protein TadD
LPQIGILLALLFGWQPVRRAPARALAAALVLLLAASVWRTRAQLPVWRDSRALFSHALAVTQHNAYAHNGLGAYLARTGDTVAARPHLEAALRIDPRLVSAHVNLGILLWTEGELEGTLAHYHSALALEPDSPQVQLGLGNLYSTTGDLARAEQHLQRACSLDPLRWQGHFNLGLVQLRLGKSVEGRASLRRALSLDPQNRTIRSRLSEIERRVIEPGATGTAP